MFEAPEYKTLMNKIKLDLMTKDSFTVDCVFMYDNITQQEKDFLFNCKNIDDITVGGACMVQLRTFIKRRLLDGAIEEMLR